MSGGGEGRKVSILIPVYNREALVGACIRSALAQTYRPLEIVVVDNRSTDRTWEVCQEYAAAHTCVKAYRNEENLGPVRNWQRCMEHATGELGKILFSDDLLYEDYLEEAVPLLKEDVAFVFAPMEIGPERGRGEASYRYREGTGEIRSKAYLEQSLLGGFGLVSPGAALFRMDDLRRNLVCREGGIPSPSIRDFLRHGAGPDLLLYLLTAKEYEKVAFLDKVMGLFRAHPGSISVDAAKTRHLWKCYLQARVSFCEAHRREWTEPLLSRGWLQEMRQERRWQGFRRFAADYVFAPEQYRPRYRFLLRAAMRKIRRRMK